MCGITVTGVSTAVNRYDILSQSCRQSATCLFHTGLSILVLGAFLPSIVLGQTTAVPNTECAALVQYTQTYTNCETYSNCSWAQCDLDQYLMDSTATFWIGERCADPIMVDLRVDGSSSLDGYRGRFSVGGDNLSADTTGPNSINVTADYGRNASHLHYHVSLSILYTLCHVDV